MTALKKNSRNEKIPASLIQERLFFLYQLQPSNVGSNSFSLYELDADVNYSCLLSSLEILIKRHEIFRTSFRMEADQLYQQISTADLIGVDFGFTDLTCDSAESQFQEMLKSSEKISKRPYNLETGPLCRFHLFKCEGNKFYFLRAMHHIIEDGSTNANFLRQLFETYSELSKGNKIELTEPEFQYADFSIWERNENETAEHKDQLEYWKQNLSGAPELLNIPLDASRPAIATSNYSTESKVFTPEIWHPLSALASEQGVSPFVMSLSVFLILLHRYSGENDVCVGIPVDRRYTEYLQGELGSGLAEIMGPMINNVVVRSKISKEITFLEFLSHIRETVQDAFLNPDISFQKIINLVKPNRSKGYASLYQVMFDHVYDRKNHIQGVISPKLVFGDPGAHDMDITARIVENKGMFSLHLRYNSDLFVQQTITRMMSSYENIIRSIIHNPNQRVELVSLLTERGIAEIQTLGSPTEFFEDYKPIFKKFEMQVDRNPNGIALIYENRKMTFEEVDLRANQLAHFLVKNGVIAGVMVGLCMERSLEAYIAILAVLKAGAAYVPLDPEYPQDRLAFIFDDSKAPVVLTQPQLKERLPNQIQSTKVVSVDLGNWVSFNDFSVTRLDLKSSPEDICYVIYTSGSTGKPKGCQNLNRGIDNYLNWTIAKFPVGPDDKVLQKTPFSFDVSVAEIFTPLITGAAMVIAKPGGHRDSAYLVSLIKKESITATRFVPSMLQVFVEEEGVELCTSLRLIIASGEALPPQVVSRFFQKLPSVHLINFYGPTEAAVDVTYWDCRTKQELLGTIPIGYAAPNNRIYIFGPSNQFIPVGVFGELCIAGIQVAKGYWNRSELSAERFVIDPFSRNQKEKMYRTGDRARFLENGAIEYLGRIDFQVKVRGFRIEPGEIEIVLLEHPNIAMAAVIAKKIQNNLSLVGYVVIKEKVIDASEIKLFLSKKLPAHMVPAHISILDSLPQITSGKIDRNALCDMKDDLVKTKKLHAPPVDEIEQIITAAWEKVLNFSPIGRDENYFSLGGDSISLIKILHCLRDFKFGLEIKDLYTHQSVASLADLVRNEKKIKIRRQVNMHFAKVSQNQIDSLSHNIDDAYPLSGMQELMIAQYGGPSSAYHCQTLLNINQRDISITKLISAFEVLIAQHPSFRAVIMGEKGDVKFQAVKKSLITPIKVSDISMASSREQKDKDVADYLEQDKNNFFNILDDSKPLWRMRIFVLSIDEVQICLTIHHCIADGWGIRRVLNQWILNYLMLRQNNTLSEMAPDSAYKEFIALEKEEIHSGHSLEFWKDKLVEVSKMNFAHKAAIACSSKEVHISQKINLDADLLKRVTRISQETNVSVKAVFLTAYLEALAELGNCENPGIAIVTNGRSEILSNPFDSTGLFWNFLPYFCNLGSITKKEKVQSAQRQLLEFEEFCNVPFNEISKVNPNWDHIIASYNFTTFGRHVKSVLNADEAKISWISRSDQFHFPINFYVNVVADFEGSSCKIDSINSILTEAELKNFADRILAKIS